jgi:hypothetical protein
MTLPDQDVPETVPQNPIMQSLQHALPRGGKLLTSRAEENLDMMFTQPLIDEDLKRGVLHVDLRYLIPCKSYRLSTNC